MWNYKYDTPISSMMLVPSQLGQQTYVSGDRFGSWNKSLRAAACRSLFSFFHSDITSADLHIVPIQNICTIMDRRTDGRTGQRTRMSSRRRRIGDTYEETFTKKHLRRDTYEETLTIRHLRRDTYEETLTNRHLRRNTYEATLTKRQLRRDTYNHHTLRSGPS